MNNQRKKNYLLLKISKNNQINNKFQMKKKLVQKLNKIRMNKLWNKSKKKVNHKSMKKINNKIWI